MEQRLELARGTQQSEYGHKLVSDWSTQNLLASDWSRQCHPELKLVLLPSTS